MIISYIIIDYSQFVVKPMLTDIRNLANLDKSEISITLKYIPNLWPKYIFFANTEPIELDSHNWA